MAWCGDAKLCGRFLGPFTVIEIKMIYIITGKWKQAIVTIIKNVCRTMDIYACKCFYTSTHTIYHTMHYYMYWSGVVGTYRLHLPVYIVFCSRTLFAVYKPPSNRDVILASFYFRSFRFRFSFQFYCLVRVHLFIWLG